MKGTNIHYLRNKSGRGHDNLCVSHITQKINSRSPPQSCNRGASQRKSLQRPMRGGGRLREAYRQHPRIPLQTRARVLAHAQRRPRQGAVALCVPGDRDGAAAVLGPLPADAGRRPGGEPPRRDGALLGAQARAARDAAASVLGRVCRVAGRWGAGPHLGLRRVVVRDNKRRMLLFY